MKTKNLIKVVMLSLVIGFSSCKKDSPTPSGNDDNNNNNLDCNGIENGTSILDDCGDCQQAYIYDYVSHDVTLLDDTNGVVLGATEMLVMPSDPGNPYWNSGCIRSTNRARGGIRSGAKHQVFTEYLMKLKIQKDQLCIVFLKGLRIN